MLCVLYVARSSYVPVSMGRGRKCDRWGCGTPLQQVTLQALSTLGLCKLCQDLAQPTGALPLTRLLVTSHVSPNHGSKYAHVGSRCNQLLRPPGVGEKGVRCEVRHLEIRAGTPLSSRHLGICTYLLSTTVLTVPCRTHL